MRKTALALAVALAASLAGLVPPAVQPASAATTDPKVVLIVGATHGQTATYRSRMDAAYVEARKYSSNVVKVYSPNATWAAVRSAMQGASIVIYMGHGNGFPSPYRTTPWPYSQNGFGLNQTAGNGDYNNVYYGEHYIGTEVKLAPNAVVLLHHLCYASGNSEPGHAEPSVTTAKQRADNYAAGFLKAGARAVIADGHMGPAYYIRGLFTTRQTINQLWRSAPNFHNHAFSFSSVRSPGYTVQMDPEGTSSGFYRSVAGRMDLQTSDVTGASYAATSGDPASFVIPGNASVKVDGAGVYADAALTPDAETAAAPAAVALGTRLRVLASGVSSTGLPTLQVEGLDDDTSGWMAASDLTPRDSTAPTVWEVSSDGPLSPNGDGRRDAITLNATLSEAATWQLRIWQGETEWAATSGTGSAATATWDGTKDGATAPDGTYRFSVRATDAWGNAGQAREGTFVVDTVAPQLTGVSGAADSAVTFTPNADGKTDSVGIGWTASEAGAVDMAVKNASGTWVRTSSSATGGGAGSSVWDGKSNAGAIVPDGSYTVRLTPRDAAGNAGAPQYRQTTVFSAVAGVKASATWFYPQDGDRLAASTTLSFTLVRPTTVTWQIKNRAGTVVRTIHDKAALAAGPYTFKWNGTNDAGGMVPAGYYVTTVTATDGVIGSSQSVSMELNAFAFRVTDATPVRGQTITVTGITAEPLKGYVYLHVYQPGIPAWSVRMTKATATSYKAAIKLRSSSTGTMKLRISALDADGRWQATYLSLPLN